MRRVIVYTILAAFIQAAFPQAGDPAAPCLDTTNLTPPFVTNAAKPNILIILDNSNSMDEDFYGNAVGSWSSASKSVIAKKALRTMISSLQGKANVGLMTFNLPTDIAKDYLYNSPYFATYNSAAFCGDVTVAPQTPPNPLDPPATAPASCVNYCINGDAASKSDCETQCRTKNPSFNSAFTDAILSGSAALKNEYCPLIYPKTQRLVNPSDSTHYIYFKGAYAGYSGSDLGSYFFNYAGSDASGTSYVAYNNSPSYSYTYNLYTTKTGTTDNVTGYSGKFATGSVSPTDTDKALGYYNFGQNMYNYKLGQAWFSNSAAPTTQMGYLKFTIADMSSSLNGYTNLTNILNPLENDSASYLNANKFCFDSTGVSNAKTCSSTSDCTSPYNSSCATVSNCTTSKRNNCPFISNAALTPTAGVLQTAYNYFNNTYTGKLCSDSNGLTNGVACSGNSDCNSYSSYRTCSTGTSPITLKCQRNFIIYVTDGLPSTKLDGTSTINVSTLMPEVLTQITTLKTGVTKTISGTSYTFPIKTYVLGLGLSSSAKTNLDTMAVTAGTQTSTNHAYYADNATELTNALNAITTDLLARVASGSSISILSEGQTHTGSNMLQGVFYPKKDFGNSSAYWPGYLYNYWFYNTKTTNNIREDTVHDFILNLTNDYRIAFSFDDQNGLTVNRYSDDSTSPTGDAPNTVDTVDLDAINPLWEAGKQLFKASWDTRRIFTSDPTGTGDFNTSSTSLSSTTSSPLGTSAQMDSCLASDPSFPALNAQQNLVKYVRGYDLPSCRSRKIGLCSDTGLTNVSNRACSSGADCTVAGYPTCNQRIWKLGDIVYSTPKVQTDYKYCYSGTAFNSSMPCSTDSDCTSGYPTCKKMENVVFVGANDGMLHAFRTGIENNTDIDSTAHEIEKLEWLSDKTTGIPNTSGANMGDELWGFIPKNSLPYLRCLALSTCHLYYNDLSPYITNMNTSDGKTRKVLIGGMRLGGASMVTPGKYCKKSNGDTNWQTCSATTDCSSPYNNSCDYAKYCFNSSGLSDGSTCSTVSNCSSPYNSSCLSASDSSVYSFNAPRDTCGPMQCSNPNTCYNPSNCTGLSSYYALDITDAENPKVLWEFSHPFLGFSYSGPAVIHKWSDAQAKTGDQYYVLFGSGPTNAYDGTSIQSAHAFVLKLKNDTLASGNYLKIDSVYTQDFGNSAKYGFTGRLFSDGVDVNGDGYTDFVLMGFEYTPDGDVTKLKGGILKLNTTNAAAKDAATNPNASYALDPSQWSWDFATYSNLAQLPITAKVETMTCFGKLYLYAGTGRYFYPLDNYGPSGMSGKNFIMGLPFVCDQYNENCAPNINSVNQNNNACTDLTGTGGDPDKAYWELVLNDASGSYLKERLTTDPIKSDYNEIFFTTSQPTGDQCGYGGRSRVWGVNCATGSKINDTSCSGYSITNTSGTLYLQTSTGAIYKISPSSSFTDSSTGFRTSDWMVGMPPENAPPLVLPSAGATSGTIIHWIEK